MSESSSPIPMHREPEDDELGQEFRIVLVTESKELKENHMDEINLENFTTFSQMNEFFDKFDEKIAVPNEGAIKYDMGSDGLVVIIVDNQELADSVKEFINEYKLSL